MTQPGTPPTTPTPATTPRSQHPRPRRRELADVMAELVSLYVKR